MFQPCLCFLPGALPIYHRVKLFSKLRFYKWETRATLVYKYSYMSSPEMLPWQTIIRIEENRHIPVYLQIANAIIREIKMGRIGPGIKMPGTRQMSQLLTVHRKTVVRAYEELDAQGWFEMKPSKGTFINEKLPEIVPRKIAEYKRNAYPEKTGFSVKINDRVRAAVRPHRNIIGFHDGRTYG